MSRPPITRRYPLEPLAAAMGDSMAALGRRLGVSGTTYKESCERGVSALVADRYAVRCGLHPAQVWPSWWDDEIAEVAVQCADCEAKFIPNRPHQRYCSKACNRRAANRRYRQRADVRDRKREKDAAYRDEVREYRNRQSRAYYRANRERLIAAQVERDRARRARRKAAS